MLKRCSVPGCERPFVAKDYCRLHYDRVQKTGSPDAPYPELEEKACTDCKIVKPVSEYSRKGRGKWGQQKYQSYCKSCENERRKARPKTLEQIEAARNYRREWADRNREKLNRQQAARRAKDPELYAWREYKNHLWKKYRLTWEEYERLYQEQAGKCAICPAKLEDNARRRPAVDHDHDSGVVRGLLCDPCNKGLGHFRDNLALLRAAVSYLERSSMELESSQEASLQAAAEVTEQRG
ncbi:MULTISPECIES: endonuclease VII domain-containing protein [Streptomyces]|uniref:Endonuclease VII domain-containing protein n=1 Tax=Streptomyces sudanensis TaxID=436397 RepID=A0ABY4TEU3_9ACTN|nr:MULTISPECIES: endonuclease VII domain-containing protein [Streptomyces]URN16991.1 endonuclease VII domain-containing protein [Streptomyces sudanensis]